MSVSISEALQRCSSEGRERQRVQKISAVNSSVAKCAEVELDESSDEECISTSTKNAVHSRIDKSVQRTSNVHSTHHGSRHDGSVLVPKEAAGSIFFNSPHLAPLSYLHSLYLR
jgi:hypothetical protein